MDFGLIPLLTVCILSISASIQTMTTIVRVKRHRGEDPVEALVLSCKRKKTEIENGENIDSSLNADSSLLKYVLNFSGTVEDKDNKTAATTVESFRKETKHSNPKTKEHVPDIKAKQRKEQKERSDDSRFTLLSCLRSTNSFDKDDVNARCDGQMNVTIFDVSKENGEPFSKNNATEDSFVYDLYSTNTECDSDYSDMFMEHLLSVQPLQTILDYRNGEDIYDEIDPDDDDSNDENNWRNDYPDSDIYDDEQGSESDDILAKQLNRCHIDNEYYNSSGDSDNEKYFNYDDNEKYCYYVAEDLAGKRYAKYKANAMKFMMEGGDDEDDDNDNNYDDDDDDDDENGDVDDD